MRRESNLQLVGAFADACADLMGELEKIDGCASAEDINVFAPEFESRYFIGASGIHLKLIIMLRDEDQFMTSCNSLFKILEKKLRSKALKQGMHPSMPSFLHT